MTAPHELPGAGTGRAHPAHRAARRRGGGHAAGSPPPRCRCPTRCSSGCRRSAPPPPTATPLGEASRDWWPQAMIWALDGQVAARAGAVVSPTTADAGRRRCWRCATRRSIPVTAAAGRSGVCGASVPVHGGVVLDLCGLVGHRRRRRDLAGARRGARHLRRPPRARAAHASTASRSATGRSRSRCRRSAAGWRAGRPASSRPATGRSRTWCWASTWPSPTAAASAPAARPARRSAPT